MSFGAITGQEHQVRVVVVDVLDLEILVPVDVRGVAHERGHLRVVVQLSAGARSYLTAVNTLLFAVADHRFVEYLTADVDGARRHGQQQQGGDESHATVCCCARTRGVCQWVGFLTNVQEREG